MTEQIEMPEEFVAPKGPGEQLRLARERLGLSLAQMSERTRIPSRQIEKIEAGNFAALPGRAYAVGFTRTLARETGLDEEALVSAVRAELDRHKPDHGTMREAYDPSDPSRVPSGGLVWFSVVAGIVLLAGLFMAARVLFSPAAQLPSLVAEQPQAAGPDAAANTASDAAPDPMGQVTLTALGPVWVRVTSGDGLRMMEGELAEGQSYDLPTDAVGPRITVGRPDLLRITIGGREVPPLSSEPVTVSNVPIDAASLLARDRQAQTSAGQQGIAAPAPRASVRPLRQQSAQGVAGQAQSGPASTAQTPSEPVSQDAVAEPPAVSDPAPTSTAD